MSDVRRQQGMDFVTGGMLDPDSTHSLQRSDVNANQCMTLEVNSRVIGVVSIFKQKGLAEKLLFFTFGRADMFFKLGLSRKDTRM